MVCGYLAAATDCICTVKHAACHIKRQPLKTNQLVGYEQTGKIREACQPDNNGAVFYDSDTALQARISGGAVVDLQRFAVISEVMGDLEGVYTNGWRCVGWFLVGGYGFGRVKFRLLIY